ncbi:formylglycine-generating enzyme family protein [Bradyrhizobium sediminis]|uniref:Formylglycine-generating enzyme family protein n=1 Tax=Bradyrhizobium sediminis TaxID=2840469 RepID=A0A975NRJ1_9BRAD|nr:SUMF1/EgtB/PvdO family nonheme iron enzyme [Bradyrhizobium sediminis]QWG19284.1 formylglycine-generating enzyme family protein [Bradyrhizobium sediminis]
MLIAFKLKLALVCAAGLAGPLAVAPLLDETGSSGTTLRDPPAFVELQPGTISYRVAGDFTRASKQIEAPLASVRFTRPLSIMKHQVSAADYQRCVDDAGCRPLSPGVKPLADRPAVQISWHDADAYASWLSRKTGEHYRLPTDEEWAYAAGSRYKDDSLPVDDNDPSKRWIARYDRESNREYGADSEPQSFGHFGANENGLYDTAGNVWEWTSTCFVRTRLDDEGRATSRNSNCGVRVAEGQHRTYVTDFIRDARAGGCAVGVPPSNLGFRLVREHKSWISSVSSGLGKALSIARS